MLQKFIDGVNGIFGSVGKWVLLGIAGLIVIIGIVLVSWVMVNLKWILLGGGVILVLAAIGFILYKKFAAPAKTA